MFVECRWFAVHWSFLSVITEFWEVTYYCFTDEKQVSSMHDFTW